MVQPSRRYSTRQQTVQRGVGGGNQHAQMGRSPGLLPTPLECSSPRHLGAARAPARLCAPLRIPPGSPTPGLPNPTAPPSTPPATASSPPRPRPPQSPTRLGSLQTPSSTHRLPSRPTRNSSHPTPHVTLLVCTACPEPSLFSVPSHNDPASLSVSPACTLISSTRQVRWLI